MSVQRWAAQTFTYVLCALPASPAQVLYYIYFLLLCFFPPPLSGSLIFYLSLMSEEKLPNMENTAAAPASPARSLSEKTLDADDKTLAADESALPTDGKSLEADEKAREADEKADENALEANPSTGMATPSPLAPAVGGGVQEAELKKVMSAKEAMAELNRVMTSGEGIEYPTGISLHLVSMALCLSVFLMALDNTIIATAIPHITDQFHSLQGEYARERGCHPSPSLT
jgi:hypothetical protein